MLQCCNAAMLQCCNAAMLQCCNAAMLQCCNASVQSVGALPDNCLQSLNADFIQNFSDSRTKFIRTPELLCLEATSEMPKQETRKSQTELSPATRVDVVDVMQFARNCHCITLLSLLLYVMWSCIGRMHDQSLFTSPSTPRRVTISV
jgi:hypothetical protein